MPRKSAMISEESSEPSDSPLRRSTRSRIAISPAPHQTGPAATVSSRTRRNSTSSVSSDVSVASIASLPATTKGVRARRPSLSQESNLERIGEAKDTEEVLTPVKRSRGSISSLHEDEGTTVVRAGSPAIHSVSDRRRSLRSASRSPTSSVTDSKANNTTGSNGTPSKLRGRRASADKNAPKRHGSVVLEALDEVNEIDSPKKKLASDTLQPVVEEAALNNDNAETLNENAKENTDVEETPTLSYKTTKVNVEAPKITTYNTSLVERVRQQILDTPKVLLSPITKGISSEKLSEMVDDLISCNSDDFKIPDEACNESVATLNADITPLNKTIEEVKMSPKLSPKRTSVTSSSSSPVRRSPRLNSETASVDGFNSPARNTDTVDSSFDRIGEKTKTAEISSNSTNKKRLTINESKEIVDGSNESFDSPLKTSILSTHEDGLDNCTTKKDDKLMNVSDESDKENAPIVTSPDCNKRVSNVFGSKNVEESFLEAMDVDYPSDDDESLSLTNQNRISMNMNKSNIVQADIVVAGDESNSGSLHFVCSDDSKEQKITEREIDSTKSRQSVALIQMDSSPLVGSFKSPNFEANRMSTVFDSRLTMLPDKVLTPLNTVITLASGTMDSVSEDLHTAREGHIPQYSDDEETINTEKDASMEKFKTTTAKDDAFELSSLIEDTSKLSSPKRKDSILSNSTPMQDNIDSTDNESSEEIDVEQEDDTELHELVLSDSQDSSDTEYRPILNEVENGEEEYDSNFQENSSGASGSEENTTSKKSKALQCITIASSGSESNNADSKLDQLILDKTAEFDENSDTSDTEFDPDKFLDDEAEEVSDLETPSEDSNEIIDVGENIEFTDDEKVELEEEEQASGSDYEFINDDEDVEELLSGHEDDNDLGYDGKATVKKRGRILTRPVDEMEDVVENPSTTKIEPRATGGSLDTTSNKRKSGRKSSSSVHENIKVGEVETAITENPSTTKVEQSRDIEGNLDITSNKRKFKRKSSISVREYKVEEVDNTAITENPSTTKLEPSKDTDGDLDTTSKKRKSKRKSSISVHEYKVGEVDNTAITEDPSTTKVEPSRDTEGNLDTISKKRKSKRKSSISVHENIKLREVGNTAITEKISNIVDIFCSSFTENKSGNVSVSVSLDYDESSNDDKKPKPPKETLNQLNKSLKRKSTSDTNVPCDSSSKIKVLQEVRISGDLEVHNITAAEQQESPSFVKKSKKKKVKHYKSPIKSEDDEVFLPDSSSHNKSKELLSTPKPSHIGALPDNVIMQLVSEEQTTSKTNVKNMKSKSKKNAVVMSARELNMYCKPSTSDGGTTGNWSVAEATSNTKPSKCNARKIEGEGVDTKDFKNLMIAKNKLRSKNATKSFMAGLKTQKKF